ncbi:MAG: Asp-tRNA(Asn)/Glu-tRNA(Gln) amidotransferase subunit GatC [Endomicrobia bacterium]|nr:Asp-tRNA(Asn)/Glu-tRNA(Gln) amidotransferase subunit GatC [Endomicrobiia bacterium]MCX7940716.1 Asp-tRNA(Asn)/Glu-tRNA(Gln) amidotransferase subunit GatC [Endomicrobiia bacterium]MDW8056434.1 Asp-tRNA(Asn)/Glu-tRNA(Gln) amidotransferase subunit GatC [Elusimicrobiota bacterium]
MNKITKDEVKYIAYLARLGLTEEEIELYSKQLEVILEYMDKLKEVDTTNVEPLTNIIKLYTNENVQTSLREDEVMDSGCQKQILENAPEKVGNYFKVEKVIE